MSSLPTLCALFTLEEGKGSWRLRLFPSGPPYVVAGLDLLGECAGLGAPEHASLDQLMIESRAGYQRRVLADGAIEITVTTEAASRALCKWLEALVASSRRL
jgi:hypothetical protein